MDQPLEWPDLDYVEASFVGEFDASQLKEFQSYLERCGWKSFPFDATYVRYIRMFHGGCPQRKYFVTSIGTDHVIERFGNFSDTLPSGSPFQDYNVETMWSNANDRLGPYLMPFAELFAGDMLCFDHSLPGRPKVVVWFHDQSDPGAPYTELVADNFDEFLKLLHA